MTTLEDLRIREAGLLSQMQALESSLVRVQMADMQGANRNAITYNLPVETLTTIFEIGHFETPPLVTKPTRRLYGDSWSALPTPFEIVVSSVSRRWRNIALETPRLWTHIYINVAQSAYELLDLYLCRSKMCLLDITLSRRKLRRELDCGPDSEVSIKFKGYLELLVPHVGRWRGFSIRRDDSSLQLSHAFASLSNLNAPALETLMLEGYIGSYKEIFTAGAPRLSSVELIGVSFWPPLEAVKHLKLYASSVFRLTYAQLRHLIQPMRSLVNLHLESSIVVRKSPTGHLPINLPSVISFEINIIGCPIGDGVLPILDLPSVEALTIHGDMDHAIRTFTHFSRLYPNVRNLKVVGSPEYVCKAESPAATKEFVSLFPSVRNIAFHGGNPIPIIHALYGSTSVDELHWPQLSSVTIIPAKRAKISYKQQVCSDIIDLVENRAFFGHPISTVKLPSEIVVRGTQRQQQKLKKRVILIEC